MTTDKVYVYFKTRDKLARIDTSKIVYFEADGNFTHIRTIDKRRTTICMNLSKMEDALAEQIGEDAHVFMRIGKRFIINLQYVYLVDAYEQKLILSDYDHFSFEVKISKDALKKMIELMLVAKI
jgi:DNA-binding LytR/AlgR family response regulator